MKISTLDFPTWDKKLEAQAFYADILDAGYTGLECVAPGHIELARNAGLDLLSLMSPGIELGLNREENHEDLLPKMCDIIYLAGENKIPYVMVFSGSRAGMSDAEGRENLKSGLQQLIPEAADNGVTILFEMLNTFDHPDYMADRATFGLGLVTEIASPNLRVLYDIYHMHRMREDYMEDLTEDIACVAHVHCAESPDRTIPQAKGEISYADIVPKVLDAGYEGYWGMEFEYGLDPVAELREAADTFLVLGE